MKILITARDVGAALHIIEIVRYIVQEGSSDLSIYVQDPAATYFDRENIEYTFVDLSPVVERKGEKLDNLLNYTREIINKEKPDVILSGLTTPFDVGIDEAIVYVAKGRIPTFLLQDFWGVINDRLGVLADYCFCLDELATILTQSKFNIETIVLGAPKYIRYADINIAHEKKTLRKHHKIGNERVIGYFGQGLHHMNGYGETLNYFFSTLSRLSINFVLLYKPHPRESRKDIQDTIRKIRKFNFNFLVYEQMASSDALQICDIACSLFSNCTYDSAFLNYYSEFPQILPINLLYNEEVKIYCLNVTHSNETPYERLGLVKNINTEECLLPVLNNYGPSLQKIWSSSKRLQNPTASVEIALQSMLHVLI